MVANEGIRGGGEGGGGEGGGGGAEGGESAGGEGGVSAGKPIGNELSFSGIASEIRTGRESSKLDLLRAS